MLPLAEAVEGGDRTATIGTDRNGDLRPAGAQYADHAATGVSVAGAQQGGDQLLGVAIEQEEGGYMCWP